MVKTGFLIGLGIIAACFAVWLFGVLVISIFVAYDDEEYGDGTFLLILLIGLCVGSYFLYNFVF